MSSKKRLFPFIFLNLSLSVFLFLFYVFFTSFSARELLFLLPALFSSVLLLYIPVSLAALLLNRVPRAGKYLTAALFSLLHVSTVVDIFIYKIFKFHINAMVLNLIFTPGGLESLDQGTGTKIFAVFVVAAVLALELFFLRLAGKFRPANLKFTLSFLFLCLAAEKSMSALAVSLDTVWITKNMKVYPLYQPLKMRSFAEKYFGIKAERADIPPVGSEKSLLNYPLSPLRFDKKAARPNVIFIVVDSLRFDMLAPETMPLTYAFSKGKSVEAFKNHYSAGNATRFGIFSVFYGLYGNYWFKMLGERRGPVLMDAFRELGYEVGIFASARVTYPEFDRTCFAALPYEKIHDRPEGRNKVEKDRETNKRTLEFLEKNKKGPFFAFVFYDSTHGSFDHPREMEKFLPITPGVDHYMLKPEIIKPVFNRYRNSALFSDSLIAEILDEAKKLGLKKNTVIIVTGDHGEAFFEKGYFGHNQNYSDYEVKVPLVLYAPGIKGGERQDPTSHLDLAPTLMKLIGVQNPAADYSNGLDLLNEQEMKAKRSFVPAFSWDSAAIITKKGTVSFPLETYGIEGIRYYDAGFNETKDAGIKNSFAPLFVEFSKESARFYK